MRTKTDLKDIIELGPRQDTTRKTVLLFFIPGNPGLIEYYRSFLRHIETELQASNVVLYGASHDGFEFHDTSLQDRGQSHEPPYSLREEIQGVRYRLQRKAREVAAQQPGEPVQVILVGHSVGAYILLEVLEWWQKQKSEHEVFTLAGGICLFPTIVDMFKSDKGRVFQYLLEIPFLGFLLQLLVHLIGYFPAFLTRLAKTLTPGAKDPYGGVEGAGVTLALAASPHGVRQVIRMARDELREIKSDKWHAGDIWGNVDVDAAVMGKEDVPRTRLFFYWGEEDYWVHSETRDKLIAKRGRFADDENVHQKRHWPVMQMDRDAAPHTFSLFPEHCERVARVTAEWIDNIVDEEGARR